jgi:hypothetical protein
LTRRPVSRRRKREDEKSGRGRGVEGEDGVRGEVPALDGVFVVDGGGEIPDPVELVMICIWVLCWLKRRV